jgi:hypothetical protein
MLRSPPIIILYKILARYRSSRNKYAQVVVLGTVSNKGKNQKYEAVGTAPKYNRQIIEICKIDTSNSQIHDNSLKSIPLTHKYMTTHLNYRLGTYTSVKEARLG